MNKVLKRAEAVISFRSSSTGNVTKGHRLLCDEKDIPLSASEIVYSLRVAYGIPSYVLVDVLDVEYEYTYKYEEVENPKRSINFKKEKERIDNDIQEVLQDLTKIKKRKESYQTLKEQNEQELREIKKVIGKINAGIRTYINNEDVLKKRYETLTDELITLMNLKED